MFRTILFLVILAAATGSRAQAPYLVRDINTTYAENAASSEPENFIQYRGRTYFAAHRGDEDKELWSTDGTAAGTKRVADIVPGAAGSNPSGLRVVNGLLLFNAYTPEHGYELWASDGTEAGTRLLLDLKPGRDSSTPSARFVHGDRMLFSADDGTHGRELWITDGTATGTRLLKDVSPGAGASNPGWFTLFNGSIYFSGFGIWKTDGTEAGTVRVAFGPSRTLVAAGRQLFYEGQTAATNWELWVSDGTEGGARMVADILPGNRSSFATPGSSAAVTLTALGDRVVFPANDGVHGRELWTSDGTAAGTRMLRDAVPGPGGSLEYAGTSFVVFRNRVYFPAATPEHGEELWVTDGTPAGTALFADLEPGRPSSDVHGLLAADGKLFFGAGTSLRVTDGTVEGLRVVTAADGTSVEFGTGSVIDGKVYFGGETALHGREPWVTDGTNEGSRMIANLAADRPPSSKPRTLTAANGLLYFHAVEGMRSPKSGIAEASLWRTDGTAAGTIELLDTGQTPPDLIPAGSLVLFTDPETRTKMLLSDGTVAGTTSADAFLKRFGGGEVEELFPFGDTLFARVEDPARPETSLWKTTGALDAPAVSLGARDPKDLIEVAGRWVFNARESGPYDRALWTTDGTPAGTYAIVPDLDGGIGRLASAAGSIFFVRGHNGKPHLWKSDGSFGGTVPVREVPGDTRAIQGAGRNLFMVLERRVWDHALWVSDGTAGGTLELLDLDAQQSTYDLVPAGNRIVFAQTLDGGVYELWASDGTKSGTVPLMKGLRAPPGPAAIDGVVYFAGQDGLHGTELWTTDGTLAGTKLLFDLNPGPESSWPAELTKAGETLYFSAFGAGAGHELWALPLTEPALALSDARAPEQGTARFTVTLAPAPRGTVTVDYATADRTARAGEDYEAAAGTLTFAPGQTSRSIDVRVKGDTALEHNETFVLTLRNAGGARIARSEGFGIVEDDDQSADLAVTAPFLGQTVLVSNAGPSAATNIAVRITATPEQTITGCRHCTVPQLTAGASALAGEGHWTPPQQSYLSAVASARESDPQPADNTTTWTTSAGGDVAMTPAYLTPGRSGSVTMLAQPGAAVPSVSSSDPTVVAISSDVTTSGEYWKFQVTALKSGTATVFSGVPRRALLVTVVSAGTTPRWPGALRIARDVSFVGFHQPVTLTLTPSGQAPVTGARATGTVVVTAGSTELARHTLNGAATVKLPVYFRSLGSTSYTIAYSGDAHFLPYTETQSVYVEQGKVAITGSLTPSGAGAFDLTVAVEGSPAVPPTGSISVTNGSSELARVALQPANGKSVAQVRLTNLTASTVTVEYLGDPYHGRQVQQIRLVAPRRRSARP